MLHLSPQLYKTSIAKNLYNLYFISLLIIIQIFKNCKFVLSVGNLNLEFSEIFCSDKGACDRGCRGLASCWVKGNALCLPLMRATSSHSVSVIFLLLKFPLLQNSLLACSAFRFMNAIIFLLLLIMRYPALFLCQIALVSFTHKKSRIVNPT